MYKNLRFIYGTLDKNKKLWLFILIFFSFFVSILELLNVALIFPILNLMNNQEKFTFLTHFNINSKSLNLIFVLIFFFSVFFIKSILGAILIYQKDKFISNFDLEIITKLYKYYLNESYTFHIKNSAEKIFTNMDFGIQLSNALKAILNLMTDLILFLFLISFLLFFNFYFTIFIVNFLILISYLYLKLVSKKIKLHSALFIEKNLKTSKILVESIKLILELKIFNKTNKFISQFVKEKKLLNNSSYKILAIHNYPRLFLELLFITILLIVLYLMKYSGMSFLDIAINLSIYLYIASRLLPIFSRTISNIQSFKFIFRIIDLLKNDLVKAFAHVNYDNENKKIIKNFKSIKIRNLFFYYKPSRIIFKNFNFDINNKDFIGIYGRSGQGKSSFVNLLLGLVEPVDGKIFIDNVDLKDFRSLLINKVSLVPQKVNLLDDTIKNNIIFSSNNSTINYKNLNLSIKLSRLSEVIDNCEFGLETKIGSNGLMLSGGQRQRIAIARALYRNPQILIFDEATNSLDSYNEVKIFEMILKELGNNLTIIVIDHNYKLLKKFCSRIYELKNKKLIFSK